MIIVLKTFTKKGDKPTISNVKDGKEYEDWQDFLSEHFREEVEKEKRDRRQGSTQSHTKDSSGTHTRTNTRNSDTKDSDKKTPSPRTKTNNEPDNIDKLKNKAKSVIENPKFKKGLKIAGLTTLGVGAATGIVAGGIKLKRKLDEKKSNKKVKEQIAGEEKK